MTFQQKLNNIIKKNNSLLCIGLDPVLDKLPKHLLKSKFPFFAFNKQIIDATHDLVCCYKPNSAFYEALGEKGTGELKKTCDYLRKNYPDILIILDAKRGDIDSTNNGYVVYAFDYLKADAITLHPYLGKEALQPFLERKDKGLFILCKTSNPGSDEFQNLTVIPAKAEIQKKEWIPDQVRDDNLLYQHIAKKVVHDWNKNHNCFLVVGATYPEELAAVRKFAGDMTFLVPGVGTQGGDLKATVKAGLNSKNAGMIISSSRDIIYDENPRQKAEELKDSINTYK